MHFAGDLSPFHNLELSSIQILKIEWFLLKFP